MTDAATATTVKPLERAQLVWQKAITLSATDRGKEPFGTILILLRAAHHGPSTMLHALALGREQQRIAPGDPKVRDAVRLLSRTVEWLGKRTDEGEVGAAGATSDAGPADAAGPGPDVRRTVRGARPR
jgi:hypothetical protein